MRIGIDLGGTKIEALALDEQNHECLRVRVPTPRDSYEAVVDAVVNLVQRVEAEVRGAASAIDAQPARVGVGIPGSISGATGLAKNCNLQCLLGHPLDRDLSARLLRPVHVANDANCFALSEAVDGAAAPVPRDSTAPYVVFGVIIGTGVGGGIVVDGRILVGPDGTSGEWGHICLPWPTADEMPLPPCWCGMHGCLELFLSGPAMQNDHHRHTGQQLSAVQIAERAAAGDPAADATLARYENRLARALGTIITSLGPDVIVLGGGVSNVPRLIENVPRLWGQYVFSDVVTTRLVRAKHGDSSGVRGAAWLPPG